MGWCTELDSEKVPVLLAEKKRGVLKALNVKSVEHKGQKRKLLLTEDGTVYKVERSKLEVCNSRVSFIRSVLEIQIKKTLNKIKSRLKWSVVIRNFRTIAAPFLINVL